MFRLVGGIEDDDGNRAVLNEELQIGFVRICVAADGGIPWECFPLNLHLIST
jgi:hypothetical protein